jgi:hypothetical protein
MIIPFPSQAGLHELPAGFRHIGWHELQFHVPASFELKWIDREYLFFWEASGRPVLELKWERAGKGSADPHRYLAKLFKGRIKGLGKKTGWKATPWEVPAEWVDALKNYIVSGFSWNVEDHYGKGVILWCPVCKKITVIRLFSDAATDDPDPISIVLRSFEDHPLHGKVLWSVYDIKARLPSEYRLEAHRFDAGRFELKFSNSDHRVIFYRWAMAERLLNQTPIHKWANSLGISEATPMLRGQKSEFLEWREARRKTAFGFAQECKWLRLKHLPEKDRILGMAVIIPNRWSLPFAEKKSDAEPMIELWEGYGLA